MSTIGILVQVFSVFSDGVHDSPIAMRRVYRFLNTNSVE
jgi:hypothetical protein